MHEYLLHVVPPLVVNAIDFSISSSLTRWEIMAKESVFHRGSFGGGRASIGEQELVRCR